VLRKADLFGGSRGQLRRNLKLAALAAERNRASLRIHARSRAFRVAASFTNVSGNKTTTQMITRRIKGQAEENGED